MTMIRKQYINYCYVIFINNTSLWWLKFLKRGFRHCYILTPLGGKIWLELNPMSNQVFVVIRRIDSKEDYFSYLRKESQAKIIETKIFQAPLKTAPIGLFSCVEMIKRLVGIHSFFTITPYQLFNKLKIVGKKS